MCVVQREDADMKTEAVGHESMDLDKGPTIWWAASAVVGALFWGAILWGVLA